MSQAGQVRADAELAPPRPLAMSIDPRPGESLIGMVARAARLNVLGRTAVILDEGGPRLIHPGTIGQDIVDCERLAIQLGCSIEAIEDRRHSYLGDPAGPADVKWGAGALFRQDVVVERRRISPASMVSSDHHRAAWMNRLLPYCAESLELLIDTCAACGKPQGWRHAWGIGFCDDRTCRAALTHPTGERIPDELAEDYRLFAGIVSFDPAERQVALSNLHPDLTALPPAVLLNLTLQIGASLQGKPFNLHRGSVGKLPPLTIAAIAARGAALLLEWPTKFRDSITAELTRTGARRDRTMLQAVRRLALPHTARPEQMAVVRKAIPEAFEHASIALAGLVKPVLAANAVCRATNISMSELRALREAGLIKHEVIVEGKRSQVQFDEADVQELARCQRESVFASRLEQRFGIPRYASEQLACFGTVQREAHPALALIHPTLRLVESSIDRLATDLEARGQNGSEVGLLPLGTAVRIIGGGPKPWGAILEAMRVGSLPFWLEGKGKFVRRALVRVEDIALFADADFEERDWPHFPFKLSYSQSDAAEILNLESLQIRRVIDAGLLAFEPDGVALHQPPAGPTSGQALYRHPGNRPTHRHALHSSAQFDEGAPWH